MTDHHSVMPSVRSRTAARASFTAAAITALVAALVTFDGSAEAATLLADDFEDGNSTGWTTSGGSWSVVTDGSRVLRQSGTSSDARARAGSAAWTDYTVTARVRITAVNGSNRFAAVLARTQSNTSYYYLALRTNNTVELKKLVGGSATTLASAPVTVTVGTWYTLRIQASGGNLRGQVDAGPLLQATDTQYPAGGIGVATFNAAANFDNVVAETAATPTTTPSTATPPPSTTPPVTTTTPPPVTTTAPPVPNVANGFAAVNALSQNGTTGGAGGPVVTVSTTQQLLDAIDTIGPMVIQVQGTINITSKQGVRPNKTIVGVGGNATINGGGLDFYRSYNVIVRNITFTNAEDDAINIGQESHHIWVDTTRSAARSMARWISCAAPTTSRSPGTTSTMPTRRSSSATRTVRPPPTWGTSR